VISDPPPYQIVCRGDGVHIDNQAFAHGNDNGFLGAARVAGASKPASTKDFRTKMKATMSIRGTLFELSAMLASESRVEATHRKWKFQRRGLGSIWPCLDASFIAFFHCSNGMM
jgi:hypothetical protein